ncbi:MULTISPECIES: serine hydrolase domain-containing protein [Spirosoma]|nr:MULTISPECIES: serine hydrolase [Spirosoma]UHG94607.1 beta-lactamase family protein [Spirosoma oryzicola]
MNFTTLICRLLVFSLAGLTLQTCTVQDHLAPTTTQAKLQQLADSVYRQMNAEWGVDKGGVLIRVANPLGSYLVSSNIAPAVQENSHFRIASITKTFTAASIMRLYQEGLISLDVPISTYLPDSPAFDVPYKNQITIRQLLQHRGGVFDVTNQDIPTTVNQPYAGKRYFTYVMEDLNQPTHTFTLEEMIGVAARNKLSSSVPGAEFHYSNTGYHLMAKIVEQIAKMSYSEYITKTFFQPLGLTNTYSVYLGTDTRMKEPFLKSYLYVPGQPVQETSDDNMSVLVSDGNVVSTPTDISTWIEKLLTGQAGISLENIAKMKEMHVADADHGVYGLGLTYNEGIGFGHDGAHLSYISTLRYNPATKTTVLAVATIFKVNTTPESSRADFLTLAFGMQKTALAASQLINR